VEVDLEPVMRDALTKGDPKIVLSLALTVVVMLLRDHAFANAKNRSLRWLATTHWGGIISSMIGAGLGAVITALSTKTRPSPGVLLNVFFIAAAASGFSTWSKLRKQAADKGNAPWIKDGEVGNIPKPDEPPLPPPPPAGGGAGVALLFAGALALTSCATMKDAAYGFKGTASYAVMETQRGVEEWNEKELTRIATTAPTRAEAETGLKKQDEKARAATKALKVCAQTIRALNDALIATAASEKKDWLRLMLAVVDAFNAARTALSTYNIPVPLPDLKLPGGL